MCVSQNIGRAAVTRKDGALSTPQPHLCPVTWHATGYSGFYLGYNEEAYNEIFKCFISSIDIQDRKILNGAIVTVKIMMRIGINKRNVKYFKHEILQYLKDSMKKIVSVY